MSKADRELSGDFANNRGKLPMPISGAYIITSHYGQYAVEGLRNVKLDNKGIDIQGKPGAQARAIFNGKVAAVFKLNGCLISLSATEHIFQCTATCLPLPLNKVTRLLPSKLSVRYSRMELTADVRYFISSYAVKRRN